METKRAARRKQSTQFRAEVLEACGRAGASVVAIALRDGLNTNVVYRWLLDDGRCLDACVNRHSAVTTGPDAELNAVQMPRPAVEAAL